jgi:2',3'-cyclic-nucleotide 2'-phosphodiesterase (5'-nucleotidase family)
MKRISPYMVREIAGFKIGIVAATTPGMTAWLRPEHLGIFNAIAPLEPAARAIEECRAQGVDALILAVHMGTRDRGDDHANQVATMAAAFQGKVDVILAGHTHKAHEAVNIGSILYTQAEYFGIHIGKVDLVFDNASRKLINTKARLERMISSIPEDSAVLSRSANVLDESNKVLQTPVFELTKSLSVASAPGRPSEVEELIAASIFNELNGRDIRVDGVLHGLFQDAEPIQPGRLTIADIWKIIPYENFLVTAELLPSELMAALSENFEKNHERNLMGFQVRTQPMQGSKRGAQLVGLRQGDGTPLDPSKRYRIALNSFDGQSGGRRLNLLNQYLQQPEANNRLHNLQTREVLIGFLQKGGPSPSLGRPI